MGVFVLTDEDNLVPMAAAHFATEDDFQRLLARFPELLSGDETPSAANHHRWLLIKREKAVPSEDGGAGRWSIDHLFVDEEGIPTLVEVKRQTDTRIRREVVGQMLDYAANAVVYWPIDQLKIDFAERCALEKENPDERIQDHLGVEADTFWQKVKINLELGRIRMLFVADKIPTELRRIVEFLNKQMSPAEVLALELRQFQGQGLKTLVPVIYGRTEEAQQRKSIGPSRQWDEEAILEAIENRHGSGIRGVARKIIGWINENSDYPRYGRGGEDGSVSLQIEANGLYSTPLYVWTIGTVEIAFQYLKKPFDSSEKQEEFRAKLNEIDGLVIPLGKKRPNISLSVFLDDNRLNCFLNVMNWCVRELYQAK
jgi:hypothetical protein